MGLFGPFKKELQRIEANAKAVVWANQEAQRNVLSNLSATINRNIAVYPTYSAFDNADRYVSTDDIYSIVRMLVTTASLIPLRAYEIKDDKAAKQLRKLMQPHSMPMQTKALQLKALEDLPDNDAFATLLEHPSYTQSKFDFFEAIYTFLFLEGESFIYKEKPEEGVNKGKPVNLYIMHPSHVVLKVTQTLPRRVVAYDYVVDGVKMLENIPFEDVIHIKYFNPELTYNGGELRGLSPIQVLKKRLTQLDSNTDVSTAQMQNGGVETIVWDEGEGIIVSDGKEVSVAGQRKRAFYQHTKEPSNKSIPYFANGKMGAISIGSTLADMKVIESAQINFKKLCNAFGTSDVLFNNGDASTESNVREMVKRTYTNTILPNVYRVRDALIMWLLPDFKDGKKRDIREDISEISELQPNTKEMVEWLAAAWWVAPNDKLEMMRFGRNPNPIMDSPLIPSGLQTLQDLEAIADLPMP